MGAGGATSQQKELFEDYDGFVEKFKPKKTTDDCFTPPEIMEVVNGYVAERWGLDPSTFARPFWPGGDYESFDYPEGCVVVDNPPFSCLTKIQEFYLSRGIRFFLFAPSLTCMSNKRCMEVDHIVCGSNITYENGAVVRTGFVTNLDTEYVLEADPALGKAINDANAARLAKVKKTVPKYVYPDAVLTSARAQWLAAHGTPFRVRRRDACKISKLDAQDGKGIFGGGLLLSERAAAEHAAAERAAAERAAAERAAAERAAAERAAAEVFELSDRELAMQAMLGRETE